MEGQVNGHTSHADEVLRHSKALRDEAGALYGELRCAVADASRVLDLKGRMERTPWLTLAAAVGFGYLLGGGLFTRATARALHFGSRALLVPLLRAQIEALAAGAAAAPAYSGSEDGQGGM